MAKIINVVAYQGKSFYSKLIRWKTASDYSHIEVVNNFIENGFDTFGAINSKGVMWAGFDWHTKGTKYDIYELEVSDEQFNKFWSFMMLQTGKKYDYKGIFGYIDNRIKQDDNKWYCSELCFEAIEHAGIQLFNKSLRYPSPDLVVLSKEMKLVKSGIVGEEQKQTEQEQNEEILEEIKNDDNVNNIIADDDDCIQEDIIENGNKQTINTSLRPIF